MARIDPQVNIRLPADLKARLDEQAAKGGRSLTAEIVQRLEASFETDGQSAQMAHDFRYVLLDLVEHGKVTSETLSRIKKNANAPAGDDAKPKKGKPKP
ncbi:MAG: hypothetical protein BGP18_05080 [Stenotrophomonas sp. 69-14]|nr:MAG: hypothetical protein BGP18_05080 [Stenotrophomonas sp. 69-14]